MVVSDAQHHVAVHGDEAAVAVVGEAFVAGLARDRLGGFVVEAEVEDRVHHARHRGAAAGAHGDEQRVFRIAELAADGGADVGERGFDLGLQVGGIGAARCA